MIVDRDIFNLLGLLAISPGYNDLEDSGFKPPFVGGLVPEGRKIKLPELLLHRAHCLCCR